jgi:hypothetical protein
LVIESLFERTTTYSKKSEVSTLDHLTLIVDKVSITDMLMGKRSKLSVSFLQAVWKSKAKRAINIQALVLKNFITG